MKLEELKKHMIVQLVNKDPEIIDPPTNVIVLEVTTKDIKRGCQADKPGLYGFRGLWYKGNGTKRGSYGKIYDLSLYSDDEIYLVRDNIWKMSKKDLNSLLDSFPVKPVSYKSDINKEIEI